VDLSDPRRIIDAIHAVLRLPRQPQVEPPEQVVEALSRRPCLLLLDNFEQLMPTGVLVVRDLLERAPLLQCLVTSRRILDLRPEREIAVRPLPVPGVQAFGRSGVQEGLDPDPNSERLNAERPNAERLNTLLQNDSVALFVDRAQQAMPHFQLTRSNATAIGELCRRLEGIPLAIELAAARVKQVAPERMLAQIERRFELLVSHKRDLSPRHQSLWAALEWSCRLLSPELQRFFARLSVFRGGWTLEAAAAVCEEPAAGEFLTLLRDHSLVVTSRNFGQIFPDILAAL
jgi:predicted ATPase